MADDKPKRVDTSKPDPELKDVCERYGHDYDNDGVCRDCNQPR